MTTKKLIKLLEDLSAESLLLAEDFKVLEDYISSWKSYGSVFAYENIIKILKDKSYRKDILSQMKHESEAQS